VRVGAGLEGGGKGWMRNLEGRYNGNERKRERGGDGK